MGRCVGASAAIAQGWSNWRPTRQGCCTLALATGTLLLLLAGSVHLDRKRLERSPMEQRGERDVSAKGRSGPTLTGVLRSSVAASLAGSSTGRVAGEPARNKRLPQAPDEAQQQALHGAPYKAQAKAPCTAPNRAPYKGPRWPSPIPPCEISASSPTADVQVLELSPESSPQRPPSAQPPLRPPSASFLTPSAQVIQVCNTTGGASIVLSANRTGNYTWKGWGTSLCWMGNYIGNYPARQLDEFLDLLFSTPRGLGLNIVRYNIGGGFNASNSPQFLVVRPEMYRGMPGFRPRPHAPYDWSADANQRTVLFGARDRGANVFIAFSNSPPWWMTYSGDVAGAATNSSVWNLKEDYYQGFADYLAEVVQRYAADPGWNLTFQYLDPVNEPSNGWRAGNFQEGCGFTPENLTRLMPLVAATLSAQNLSTRLIGWDLPSVEDLDAYVAVPKETLDLLALFQHHMYLHKPQAANKTRAALSRSKQVTDLYSKETWMSGWGPDGADGTDMGLATYLARVVLESVNLMGASAWVYWQAIDSTPKWTLIETPCCAPFKAGPTLSYRLTKKYHVLKQFAQLVPPGSINLRLQSTAECDHCVAAFFVPAQSYLAVLVVNHLASAYRIALILSGFSTPGNRSLVQVRTYRTSEVEDYVLLGSAPVHARRPIHLECAGHSVTTFAISDLTRA